jgi:hypothetical protein
LTLQAEGKLDKPVFGVHYDTPENKFDFESVNPDNPFNEDDDDDDDDDDDGELFLTRNCECNDLSDFH